MESSEDPAAQQAALEAQQQQAALEAQQQQAALEAQQQQQQQTAQQQQQQNQQQQTPSGPTTTVEAGEGLQQIANRTGVPAETIAELNGITITGDTFYPAINPGQELRIQ
nr:LysM peptidoglycan-binding domain-containing protein [Enterococcus sp. 669A]